MNHWPDGFTASMTITNVSDAMIEDWKLKFSFGNEISQIWNAAILQKDEGQYVIGNEGYNSNIPSQQSITFGFLCEEGEKGNPEHFSLEEYKADGTVSGTEDSDIEDPDIEDPDIEDPDIEDPEIEDPDIEDPDIEDPEMDEFEKSYDSDVLTEDNAFQYVHIEMQPGNTERCVIDDVVFVNDAEGQYEVEWISSEPHVVSDTGKVSRPEKDQSVVITAVITGDGQSVEVPFPLEVKAKPQIAISEIEDYNLEDLEKLNQGDEEFETIVNDFGYLQEVYGKYSDFKVDSYESALYALYHVKSAIGITDPFTELIPYRTFVDDTGYTFHFAQVIQGMITFDNIVVVSSNAQGETDYLKSGYYPVEGSISTIPQVSYPEAEEILAKQYGEITVSEEHQNKICVVNYYGHVDLVWDICCQLDSKQDEFPSGSYHFLVGAADGEVKFHSALASDLFFKQKTKRVKTEAKDLEGIKRVICVTKKGKIKHRYYLEDPFYHIIIRKGQGNPEKKEEYCGDIEIRKKKNKWKPVEVSAMYNMKKILRYYFREFKRVSYTDNNHDDENKYTYSKERNSQEGDDSKVVLVDDYEDQAIWNPTDYRIYIGTGSGKPVPCVSRDGKSNIVDNEATKLKKISFAICQDVLCHEYTHGVIGNDTNLEDYTGIPGAIDEAYADIAACFMDGNWQIGEKIGKKLSIRNISQPASCFTAVQVGGDYYVDPINNNDVDRGGEHANSTVISHAVYLMTQKGIPQKALQDIWYNTIRKGLDGKTNFYNIRKLFITSCKKQGYSAKEKKKYIKIIKSSFDATNVKKANCNLSYRQYGIHLDRTRYTASYFCDSLLFQGKVAEADGDLLAGNNKVLSDVSISIRDLEGKEIGTPVMTDQKGRYQINSGLGQAYVLTFHKQGYQEERMYLSDINELLQQEYYCDTVELLPQKDGSAQKGQASGTLYDAATMEAVSGMELIVRRGMNNIHTEVLQKLRTNDAGAYHISEVEAGIYCVEVPGTEDYGATFFNIKVVPGEHLKSQHAYLSSSLDQGQMRAVLTWDEVPGDLDAHMLCELSAGGKGHVYYKNKEYFYQKKKICALDVDDRDGYGPETMTVYCGETGSYHYYIHQYSSGGRLENSNASVQVYLPGKAYPSYTFHVPAGTGRYQDVFRYNSATGRMLPINTIESTM